MCGYYDIVEFINRHDAPTAAKHLQVNVIEVWLGTILGTNLMQCLLRGVMRNDEPSAPLNFLFSSKFMATDRSRASMYAISQCLGYILDDGLAKMIKVWIVTAR